MGKVVRLKIKKPVHQRTVLSVADFLDYVDTVELYLSQLEKMHERNFDQARKLMKEIRFNAAFSHNFRQESSEDIMELADLLYLQVNGE